MHKYKCQRFATLKFPPVLLWDDHILPFVIPLIEPVHETKHLQAKTEAGFLRTHAEGTWGLIGEDLVIECQWERKVR